MRLSEKLRKNNMDKVLVGDKFTHIRNNLIQAADLLDVYYIQSKAITVADRLSESKMLARTALLEDV